MCLEIVIGRNGKPCVDRQSYENDLKQGKAKFKVLHEIDSVKKQGD